MIGGMNQMEDKNLPAAFERLNQKIFCEEYARKLPFCNCSVVYTNNRLLRNLGIINQENQLEIDVIVADAFAYVLTNQDSAFDRVVFSDRQADPTDVALSGNEGSGRACYIGKDVNIKGIGRTQLVKNPSNSLHGTGTLDLVTALREAVMSSFICEHTMTGTSEVLAVIARTDTTKYVWSEERLQNALLVRLDKGTLDRVSHVAYTPIRRQIDLSAIVDSFARFDAEMFGHRILHGAWSSGNSSLKGVWLDMESASIVQGRGARCNITKKYVSNYFGYEAEGIKQVIDHLVNITGTCLSDETWKVRFDAVRRVQLHYEFMRLFGIPIAQIPNIMMCAPEGGDLSSNFEMLARKISPRKTDLNVFGNADAGTHVLDFSRLLRNLPRVYRNKEDLLSFLIREKELGYCAQETYTPDNSAERYLAANAVICRENVQEFARATTSFVDSLLCFTQRMESGGLLPKQDVWEYNAYLANKDYPTFDALTRNIRKQVTNYQGGKISSQELNKRMNVVMEESHSELNDSKMQKEL